MNAGAQRRAAAYIIIGPMVIFSCKNLSKTFHEQPLFTDVTFGMDSGDRVGIIGRNGAGKTTLLRIIAGQESADEGRVVFNTVATFEYLEQLPRFSGGDRVLDAVIRAQPETLAMLDRHRELCTLMAAQPSPGLQREFDDVTHAIEHAGGWDLESEARKVLQRLGVSDFEADVRYLSGGQRKRVALARALLSDPDLLILDEPTNHLDADSVQWLQDRLMKSDTALLLITHDRYFLDAVATRIVELDQQQLISYPGSYEEFLERKAIAVKAQEAEEDHRQNKLRQEIEWLRRGAPARRTKARARVKQIEEMRAVSKRPEQKRIQIEVGSSFLGSRIIDAVNISKSIDGKLLFRNFTYHPAVGDRIGIIGANGCGKSTLLRVLCGELESDTGSAKIGESVQIGFFRQENPDYDPTKSVLATLRSVAEYIDTGVGRDRYLSAADMLVRFHFPHKKQHALVGTLSGGEKRRLTLLMILMSNPNVLFLDEPTNDFDIQTLNALEDYLDKFKGFLLVVSHDRAFLDRTVDYIYAFEGDGVIKQYPGNYSAYLERKEADEAEQSGKIEKQKSPPNGSSDRPTAAPKNRKALTWKEERELELLEERIASIEGERDEIESQMASGAISDHVELIRLSERHAELQSELEASMDRWLELEEKKSGGREEA